MQTKLVIPKPSFGQPCNGCGYCCAVGPCELAQQFLHCTTGPCVALEWQEDRAVCGLVRNPLGYLFKAAHPEEDVPLLEDSPDSAHERQLSSELAMALGIGKGCDSDDDEESAAWSQRVFPLVPQ